MSRRNVPLGVGLALAALLTAGCWGASGGPYEGPSPSPTTSSSGGGRLASPPATHLQVELRATRDGPSGVLTWGSERQEGVPGSYCWVQSDLSSGTSKCLDMALSVPEASVAVPRASVLYVTGDHTTATARLLRLTGDPSNPQARVAQRLPLVEGATAIRIQPGRYVLEVHATWPQGDVPLFFGLTVT